MCINLTLPSWPIKAKHWHWATKPAGIEELGIEPGALHAMATLLSCNSSYPLLKKIYNYVHTMCLPVEARRGPQIRCEPLYWCQELNPVPLQEWQVLLTPEPSLQPICFLRWFSIVPYVTRIPYVFLAGLELLILFSCLHPLVLEF